jgi:predicted Zn-dependent protease
MRPGSLSCGVLNIGNRVDERVYHLVKRIPALFEPLSDTVKVKVYLVNDVPLNMPACSYSSMMGGYFPYPFFSYAALLKEQADKKLMKMDKHLDKVLVLTDKPLAGPESRIYGEADIGSPYAIVSTHGLYDGSGRGDERLALESCYLLGRTMDLPRCDAADCIMHPARTLTDIDARTTFCDSCARLFKARA